jgi:hypothetical protein
MHIYAYIFHTNMKCLMVYGTVHVGLKIVFSQRSAVALRVRVLRRNVLWFGSGLKLHLSFIHILRTSIEMKSKHE